MFDFFPILNGVTKADVFHVAIMTSPAIGGLLFTDFGFPALVYGTLCAVVAVELHDFVKGQSPSRTARDFMFRMLGGVIGVGVAALVLL